MKRSHKRLLITLICFLLVAIPILNQTPSPSEPLPKVQITPLPLPSTQLNPQPSASNSGSVSGVSDTTYLVTRVIDGDTIELESGQKVRYIGIDTPEVSFIKECLGTEAKIRNKALVEQKMVRLEKDVSEIDRYGRLLRYVYVDDSLVNEILVQEGYAQARSYPPDIAKQDIFIQAEQRARELKVGLWGGGCQTSEVKTQM